MMPLLYDPAVRRVASLFPRCCMTQHVISGSSHVQAAILECVKILLTRSFGQAALQECSSLHSCDANNITFTHSSNGADGGGNSSSTMQWQRPSSSTTTTSWPHATSSSSSSRLWQHHSSALHHWQHAAQLSPAQAQAILQRQPYLHQYLRCGQFQPANLSVNLRCLAVHLSELAADEYAALRGTLALLPPSILQSVLHDQSQHQLQQLPHLPQQQSSRAAAFARLEDLIFHVIGPLRSLSAHLGLTSQHQHQAPSLQCAQYYQQSLLPAAGQSHFSQRQQQQARRSRVTRSQLQLDFFGVAAAVVGALDLPPDTQLDAECLPNQFRQAEPAGSSSTLQLIPSSTSQSSQMRSYSNHAGVDTAARNLVLALQRTARSNQLRYKPLHSTPVAAQLAEQLQHAAGCESDKVLQLLLRRPALLWQHVTPRLPSAVLSELEELLPGLHVQGRQQLVQELPLLFTCGSQQLQDTAQLLLGRLQLSQEEAAQVVLQHPALLLQPVKQITPNLGFLVGLGLRPLEIRSMVVKDPKWLTHSLRDLTVQWHFIEQVIKGSVEDVVQMPQLLTLPLSTRLGPRTLYARKRQIKLLAPSLTVLAGESSSLTAKHEWRKHRMVPLRYWLTASEREMCSTMDLNLDDFKRFKAAWERLNGVTWQRLGLDADGSGCKQQLKLLS